MDKTDVKRLLEIIKIHQEMINDLHNQLDSFIKKQVEINQGMADLMDVIRKLAMAGTKKPF